MLKYLPLFLIILPFLSCQKADRVTVLAGNLEGYEEDHVILYASSDRYGYNNWLSAVDTADVSGDGEFRFTLAIDKADFFNICNSKGYTQTYDIYLEPGDSLYVTLRKINDKNVFAYNGSHAGAYAYYPLRDSTRQLSPVFRKKDRDLYYLPSADTVDVVLQDQLKWEMDLIASHFGENPDWAPIAQLVKDQRRYEVYDQYYRYLYYHNYYSKDTFLYVFPDTAYYDFVRDADLSYSPLSYMWQYQSFLSDFVQDRIEHEFKGQSDSLKWENYLQSQFNTIKTHLHGVPRDVALFSLTNDFSHAMENKNFYTQLDDIEKYFNENHTSEHFLKAFVKESEKFKALKAGSPVPDMALPDINGDTIRFSDLKGKVLYVDFWGTWCYPCLQELPHSLTLQEKLKDEKVEFVYIGLEGSGEQVAEWKDFVSGRRSFSYAPFLEQRVYPGIHLLSEGQFGNPEIQPFMINSAPSYMLIDAKGNIARARAPRPSDPEIEKVIRELLPG